MDEALTYYLVHALGWASAFLHITSEGELIQVKIEVEDCQRCLGIRSNNHISFFGIKRSSLRRKMSKLSGGQFSMWTTTFVGIPGYYNLPKQHKN